MQSCKGRGGEGRGGSFAPNRVGLYAPGDGLPCKRKEVGVKTGLGKAGPVPRHHCYC